VPQRDADFNNNSLQSAETCASGDWREVSDSRKDLSGSLLLLFVRDRKASATRIAFDKLSLPFHRSTISLSTLGAREDKHGGLLPIGACVNAGRRRVVFSTQSTIVFFSILDMPLHQSRVSSRPDFDCHYRRDCQHLSRSFLLPCLVSFNATAGGAAAAQRKVAATSEDGSEGGAFPSCRNNNWAVYGPFAA
jgi:hypothetical protein